MQMAHDMISAASAFGKQRCNGDVDRTKTEQKVSFHSRLETHHGN
jgi:hypothetical protein